MDDAAIAPIGADGKREAIATVVAAFAADPVERWLYPEDSDYERHFPGFVAALGGLAFGHETAWGLESPAAIALWLGPGVAPDEDAVGAALLESVAKAKHEELLSVLGQMSAAHPGGAHWYLPWLGVAPGRQNEGLGGRLLAATLAVVDSSGLPAFLETPNPRNVPFYERHGFEVVATTESPSCPPLTSMLRAGRAEEATRA